MTGNQQLEDSDDGIPELINSAIQNRYGPIPSVPGSIDKAIIADARQHLAPHVAIVERRRPWSTWQWAATATAVTAVCVMCFIWLPNQAEQDIPGTVFLDASSPRENDDSSDFDQNGRVDILDAFAMARRIRSGGDRGSDVNNDGRFDELDVDLVARRAVML